MAGFELFDQRHYRTVGVAEGYAGWVDSYEDTVEDVMDLALLDRVRAVDWAGAQRVADLGCGTGRTARWLTERGTGPIDGVDLTPHMLERARARGLHASLSVGDVRATGLADGGYDLVVCSLVDEHLADLTPFYAEVSRLLVPQGAFVLVSYHPFFIMATGMPTHFDDADGEPVAIETHLHLPSAHVQAGRAAGLHVEELHEGVVDDAWIQRKPKWAKHRGVPVSFAWAWRKPALAI